MTALSAGSITYTISNKRRLGNSKVMNKVQVTLAAGQTYPTGGLKIGTGTTTATGVVGCPNTIESCIFSDVGTSGYVPNYNTSTGSIQLYYVNVATTTAGYVLAEVLSTVTPGAITFFADIIGW
jgi:hypothetical protein